METKLNIQNVINFVYDCDEKERSRIVQALNNRTERERLNARRMFNIGNKVEFTTKYGMIVKGTLVKMNAKSFHVYAEDGMKWRVSPQLVRHRSESVIQHDSNLES